MNYNLRYLENNKKSKSCSALKNISDSSEEEYSLHGLVGALEKISSSES